MGPILVDDRRLTMALGEDLEHGDVRAGIACRQLTVAKSPGTSFAEEVVAFGIDGPASSKRRTSAARCLTSRPRSSTNGR